MSVNIGSAVGYLTLDRSPFTAGLMSAGRDLDTFLNRTKSGNERIQALGSTITTVGSTVTKTFTVPLLGVGAAATMTAANFQEGMSKVQAISGATASDMELLSSKAKEMGAKTKFSANEASEALSYMAMAGWKTTDMLDGLEGIMDLAAASGEDLGLVSDIVTDALTAFGLQAKDSAHFADVLAMASNASNTSVSMLGESFKYFGPVAGAMKYSIEDTAIAMGIMANSGIKASQAGTALRAALASLLKPSDPVFSAMEKYNISLTRADGSTKSLNEVMLMLRNNLGGLDEAEKAAAASTLFGTEAMSGMLAIVNASDTDFNNLSSAINNCDGTTAKMAATMQDNLKGSITKIKSALEGAAISIGERLIPMIGSLADKVQDVVDWFNDLDDTTKDNIVRQGLFVAAAGPVLIVLGKLTSGIGKGVLTVGKLTSGIVKMSTATGKANLIASLTAKGGIGQLAASFIGLNPITIAVGAGIVALGAGMYVSKKNSDLLNKSILYTTDEMSGLERTLSKMNGTQAKSKEELIEMGLIYRDFSENISPEFQEQVKKSAKELNDFSLFLGEINIDKAITEDESAEFNNKVGSMCDRAIETIKSKQDESTTALMEVFASDTVLDKSEKIVLSYYQRTAEVSVKEVTTLENEIYNIKAKALEEKRELNEAEIVDIQTKLDRISQLELEALGSNQEEIAYAKNEFIARVNSIDLQGASDLMKEKGKLRDEEVIQIRAHYDAKIDLLKADLNDMSETERNAALETITNMETERDKKIAIEQGLYDEFLRIIGEKNPEILEQINRYNGEILAEGDKRCRDQLNAELAKYDELNKITEDGLYSVYNNTTKTLDHIQVKTDATTGEIIAMGKVVSDEYGTRVTEITGYSDEYIKKLQEESSQAYFTRNAIREALADQSKITYDWKSNTMSYCGSVIGKFKDVTEEIDGTKTGIIDLNGTPVKIIVDKNGAIKNINDIQNTINNVQGKTVYLTVKEQRWNASASSGIDYATGTTNALSGYKWVGEHGPELVRLEGGERIYNTVESKRIANSINDAPDNKNSYINIAIDKMNRISEKLNDLLNTESTIEMRNSIELDGKEVGAAITPIVSNKFAIASMKGRRR